MKKFYPIMMLALFAIVMVSCAKEENNNSNGNTNGSGNDTPTVLADNTLVYDGQTYTFDNVVVDYYHSELTLLSAFTNDTLDNGSPVLEIQGIHIMPNMWNQTLNLTDVSQWPEDVMVALHLSGVLDISFEAWNNGGNMGSWGTLDSVQYENESIFSSGTYSVMGNNDGTPITVTYDGMLKNNKKIQIKIVSNSYNI